MSVGVIGFFEVVKIDAQNSEPLATRPCVVDHGIHSLAEGRPIGQVGQRVMMRHVRDALFRASPLCHIINSSHQICRLASFVANDGLLCISPNEYHCEMS